MTRARAFLPPIAIVVFGATTLAILASAGATLGYDYQAYVQAAQRLLDGQPLYDPAVDVAGGFAIFLYPPPFAVAFVPFALLGSAGLWVWTGLLVACVIGAIALMPVSTTIRWGILLLAGLDWPVLYSLKLGQVGPILLLLFVLGWRWLDDPMRLGASAAVGTAIKLQPAMIFVWAMLTRRWLAVVVGAVVLAGMAVLATILAGVGVWSDFATLVRQVGDPITTPHNFTPGAIAYQLGAPSEVSWVIQLVSTVLVLGAVVVAARMATVGASYLVAVIASQLLSPVLWDHYAMLLLLPVAYLCAAGCWWALLIPLVTATPLIGITPPIAYPLGFYVVLGATVAVGIRAREAATA